MISKAIAVLTAVSALGFAGAAFAGQPMPLSNVQLDQLTAGSTNIATITETGEFTIAAIVQGGGTNSAEIGQTGDVNQAAIVQNSGPGGFGFEITTGATDTLGAGSGSTFTTVTVTGGK